MRDRPNRDAGTHHLATTLDVDTAIRHAAAAARHPFSPHLWSSFDEMIDDLGLWLVELNAHARRISGDIQRCIDPSGKDEHIDLSGGARRAADLMDLANTVRIVERRIYLLAEDARRTG